VHLRLGSFAPAGVLNVAKLTPGQEAYCERSVADGIDDYYAVRGVPPEIWAGSGSRQQLINARN